MKKPLAIWPIHIVIVITLCTIGFYVLQSGLQSGNRGKLVVVDRIIDGDTFESLDNIVYRLIGINTPERGEYGYEEATKFLSSIICTTD